MKPGRFVLFFAVVFISVSISSFALQITQIEFDLHMAPGATDMYTFQVINNESDPQDVTVYIGDWTRTETGENDFLKLDSARWLFGGEFKQGDELDVKYRVTLPNDGITVSGTYACGSPSAQGQIAGAAKLLSASDKAPVESTNGLLVITRTVTAAKTDGTVTVNLHMRALQDFGGLRIDEVFSSHVKIESLDDAGGEFSTIPRSCGDWIAVSPQSFRIAPSATQPVSFRVVVPNSDVSGMYWAMIFVQGSPRPQQREGATVLAIERFGLKVYETIPGSEALSGEVRSVRKVGNDPLTFKVTFANTGNVQLRPTGTINVINQSGDTTRRLAIDEFPILPGSERTLVITDESESPLPAGIYRALVTIDYGGDNLAGGTRDFRLR
ncbi:MAG: hypothetical protein U9Q94_00375 [Candidatus Bipolaricaulota bacterium]|nr:hypothetical protein [Candidatus Bipolaricaulota bacterium]